MCDLGKSRYMTLHHVELIEDGIPVDLWLNENVPDEYRVVSIFKSNWDHGVGYEILLELT
jgi:hypothetical protein